MSVFPNLAEPSLPDARTRCAAEPVGAPREEWAAADADPGTLLQRVADEAAALAEHGAASLLVTTSPGRYRVIAVSGPAPVLLHERVDLDDGVLAWGGGAERTAVALSRPGAPAPVEDRTAVPGVPLRLFGREVGLLVAFAESLEAPERDALQTRLAQLGQRVAPAVAARQLDVADAHLTELNSIVEVGQVLTGLLDMEDVLSYVVYLAESLVSGHCAGVALVSEDGNDLVLHNSTGSLRDSEGNRFPIRQSLIGWVVEKGQPVVTPCVSDDPRGFAVEARLGPGVAVPIQSSGQVIGSFLVARVEGAPGFGPESVTILQKMAAYAAIAITNADIHRTQRRTAETLRRQAEELEQAYGELSRSQEQLLISEKMAALGRVTAGIAHEINSPLAGILNSLRTARSFVEEYRTSVGDPEITADDHRAIADDILNALSVADTSVNKVAQYVRTIKGQTRVGEGLTSVFDPAAEVDSTVVLLQHELRRRRVAVFTEMERGHRLSGDQGKFGLVIQNLISNAIDAYQDEPGEMWVRIAAEGDRLRLRVEDRGCGIPEEIRGRIFDYLFTTKDVGKGTGLGLAMVHSVVTSTFRGEIALESEPGVGTTFILTFPLTPAGNDNGA